MAGPQAIFVNMLKPEIIEQIIISLNLVDRRRLARVRFHIKDQVAQIIYIKPMSTLSI